MKDFNLNLLNKQSHAKKAMIDKQINDSTFNGMSRQNETMHSQTNGTLE